MSDRDTSEPLSPIVSQRCSDSVVFAQPTKSIRMSRTSFYINRDSGLAGMSSQRDFNKEGRSTFGRARYACFCTL